MQFTFRPMNEGDARTIAGWHYEEPYTFYDWEQDPDDLAELLDPRSWAEAYYAAVCEQGELVGFFAFKRDGATVDLGLGLRPDLTGRGLGLPFLLAGLDFARARFSPTTFSLAVATFNTRAIRVYERAGFARGKVFMHHTNGGEYEFLEMTRGT